MLIILKNRKGTIDAKADYNNETGRVVVKKGSLIAKKVSSAPTFRSRKSMLKRREGVVKDGEMIQDLEFGSLSTAATFVAGSNRNGWVTWRDADGKSIAELFGKTNDN